MLGRPRDHRPHIPQPQPWATTVFPLLLMLLLLLPLPLPLLLLPPPLLPLPPSVPLTFLNHQAPVTCTMTVLGQCRPCLSHQSLHGT